MIAFNFCFFSCLLSDNCKKLGLVFENVVGIVEIINSKAVQLQVVTDKIINATLSGAAFFSYTVTLVTNQLLLLLN